MLRFENVKWKNLLATGNSFTEVNLNRSKTTLIIGHNGAGKSTLLEAMCFVLYGRPFRDIVKPLLVNSITNKQLVVEINFKADGKPFKVIRGMKPTRFEIYRDGKLINQDDKSVDYQKYIETEVLRMNYKSFKQVVILGSAGYTPFMDLKADARRVISEDILDIHVFSSMYSLLKKEIDLTNDQLHDILAGIEKNRNAMQIHENHLNSKQDDYDSVVRELQLSIDDYVAKIEQLENDIAQLSSTQQELTLSIADQNKVVSTLEQVRSIERSIEDRMLQYRNEVRFYADNHSCPTCSQDINEEFKETTIHSHEDQLKTLEAGIVEIDAKREKLEIRFKEIQSIVTQITNLSGDMRDKNVEIQMINSYVGNLNAQMIKHTEQHDQHEAQSTIRMLSRAISNDEAIRKTLMEQREVQEYALVLLKDSGIKAKVIKKYIPVINKLINKYLAAMGFFITFELNEQFQETIKSIHRETFTYNSFSEGEKLRINLAILFAWRDIAKMRNSMSTNLLIMDEIFDSSLDDMGTEEFMKILENVTGDTNVFVISHKATMFDKFRSVIKFEKAKNFSKMVQDGAAE
jgi:DNA repair exonuclease SbcCD ATPase subunit